MTDQEAIGVMDEQTAPPAGPDPGEVREEPAGGAAPAEPEEQPQPEAAPLAQDLAGSVPDAANLDMLLDVGLKVTVELGRAQMKFRDVLNLSSGAIVELSRQTSEPVDILVNGALLATGEVVVMDDHFAVRITKLLSRGDRLQRIV
jgi:flagellar motor switch protein FliN/FliY